MSLNEVCGSGLRAVSIAALIIKAGDADIILAGGRKYVQLTTAAPQSPNRSENGK